MTGGSENGAGPPSGRRPDAGQLLARALRLRCPRCGSGRLFRKWFAMHQRCADCGLRFEPAPGYYLGAIYISYGLTAVLLIVSYLVLHNGLELSNQQLSLPMLLICVLVPLSIFRHARALWLALDCFCDVSVMNDDTDTRP
jgi:uncharacterized protein (DUF983 family)